MSIKIKALWGFVGDTGYVHRGEVVEVSKEYGYSLIGKGLAEEEKSESSSVKKVAEKSSAPKDTKQAAPAENK